MMPPPTTTTSARCLSDMQMMLARASAHNASASLLRSAFK
jgi:hypothetical protein